MADNSDLSLSQLKVELVCDLLGIGKSARYLQLTEAEAKSFLKSIYSGVDHLTLDQIFTDGGFYALFSIADTLNHHGFSELLESLESSFKRKRREFTGLYFELTARSFTRTYDQSTHLLPTLRLPPRLSAARIKLTASKLEELCSKLEHGEYIIRGGWAVAGSPDSKPKRFTISVVKFGWTAPAVEYRLYWEERGRLQLKGTSRSLTEILALFTPERIQ